MGFTKQTQDHQAQAYLDALIKKVDNVIKLPDPNSLAWLASKTSEIAESGLIEMWKNDVMVGAENWRKSFEKLMTVANNCDIPSAKIALSDCSNHRTNCLSNLLARGQVDPAEPLQELANLEQHSKTAKLALHEYYEKHSNSLLEKAKQYDHDAINDLNKLAETRSEAMICFGLYNEYKGNNGIAFNYFRQATEAGNPKGYYHMGRSNEEYDGGDVPQALYNYYLAAKEGEPESLKALEDCANRYTEDNLVCTALLYHGISTPLIGKSNNFVTTRP